MIIAVDFDGTLCHNAYPEIGAPLPGAVAAMQKLKEQGHYIIIWTCRHGDRLTDAVNWLLEHQIPFDRVNDHNPDNVRRYGAGGKKVYAHCYIDDRALGGFPGWYVALDLIDKQHGKENV